MQRKIKIVLSIFLILAIFIFLFFNNFNQVFALVENPNGNEGLHIPENEPEPEGNECYWLDGQRVCCYESKESWDGMLLFGNIYQGQRVCCYDSDGPSNFNEQGYVYLKVFYEDNTIQFTLKENDACVAVDEESHFKHKNIDFRCPLGYKSDLPYSDPDDSSSLLTGAVIKIIGGDQELNSIQDIEETIPVEGTEQIPEDKSPKETIPTESIPSEIIPEAGEEDPTLDANPPNGRYSAPFEENLCSNGCLSGRCFESSPAVEAEFVFYEVIPGFSVSTKCEFNANPDLGLNRDSLYKQVIVKDFQGTTVLDDFSSDESGGYQNFLIFDNFKHSQYPELFPGIWEINCYGEDNEGNSNEEKIIITTNCDPPCYDAAPPAISSFGIEPLAENLVWVEAIATDSGSGTDSIVLTVKLDNQIKINERVKCHSKICKIFKILEGQGDWEVNIAVFDNDGNSIIPPNVFYSNSP